MNKKKVTCSALAAILLTGTTGFQAFAAMDEFTAVFGDKAFAGSYLANLEAGTEDADAITNHILEGGTVYFKDLTGTWYDVLSNEEVESSVIPKVTYKDAEGA
jgi:hypothetical protein